MEQQTEAPVSVLVVDDDEMIREILHDFLVRAGYEAEAAPSGELALAALLRQPRDLVVTDVMMPGMDGLEVLRRVKENWPETEVIVVTGYASLENGVRAMKEGAYDFLIKPVKLAQFDAVLDRCARWIRYRRTHEELLVVHRRLEELAGLKRRFLAVADHELRTPVTVLDGMVRLLAARAGELPDDLAGRVQILEQVSRRLVSIVRDVRDLVQSDAGRFPVSLDRTTIVPVVRGLRTDVEMIRALRDLDVSLDNRVPEDRVFEADASRLRQAVGELLANAATATADGGRVAVVLDVDAGHPSPRLRAEVADTGAGIPADERQRIFDLFHALGDGQHHHTSRYEYQGSGLGLGLSIVAEIARAHGGGIDLDTEPGRGSTFTLWIPLKGTSP